MSQSGQSFGRVHLIELAGAGGIFQHCLELARVLTRAGVAVTVHTARSPELTPPGVHLCRCFRRDRRTFPPYGRTPPRLRQAGLLGYFLVSVLPHLYRSIGPGDIAHVQGLSRLTPELITVLGWRRATIVTSAHDTFVRQPLLGARRSLDQAIRRSDRVLVHSRADAQVLAGRATAVGVVPLVQWVSPPDPDRVRQWRRRLGSENGAALAVMPGDIRPDKNHTLFIRAMAGLGGWRGAIVGNDLGAGRAIEQEIAATGAPITTTYGYLSEEDFMAVVAAADVIVAPYLRCSQSGVVAVARRLGVPTAVLPTGGLAEVSTAVATDATPDALAAAIADALARPVEAIDPDAAAGPYIEQYRLAQGATPRAVVPSLGGR